jgi:uncharacterized protein YjbK
MAIEREVKIRLAAEEACRLAEALGCPLRTTHQRNHYLDTPGGALRRRGYGLRLRTEQESHKIQRFLLTLKGPTTIRGVVTEREEQEIEVDRATAEAILAEKVELPRLGLHLPGALSASPTPLALICLGASENERRTFRLGLDSARNSGTGLVLELDRTTFPDGSVDYEAEIEMQDLAAPFPEAAVRALLARAGVAWVLQTRSKFARFLERSGISPETLPGT